MKYRELRDELKKFGIYEDIKRGKGSERLFFHLDYEGKGYRSIPATCHGEGKEVRPGMLQNESNRKQKADYHCTSWGFSPCP